MAQQGDESTLEEAKNLLVQGRRCMALEDYQSATDLLERSCQLFDAFYGVAKRECADAYLEYGLALVASANLEAGSGTDKLLKKAGIEEEDEGEDEDEEDEDEEAEDEEQEEQQNGEEGKTNGKEHDVQMKDQTAGDKVNEAAPSGQGSEQQETSKSAEEKTTNGDVPMDAASSTSPEKAKTNGTNTVEPQASSSASADPTPGTSSSATNGDQDQDDDVENEEASTMEIAWEVLCLAKRLYMTDESLEGRTKLAETLQKIGEISIEWDNNDNAVSILEECLKIRTAMLQPEDRLIAMTYYYLGLAHSYKSETQQANENFQNAINVIEKRIASVSQDLEKAKASQDTLAIGTYQKEINELKELLPDMTMRLDDSKEDSIKSTEVMKRTREEMQQEDEEVNKVCSDKSKPVDDISHLVKRRAA